MSWRKMTILAGTAHPELSRQVAKAAGVELGGVDVRRFPDGEIFVKINENVRGDDVFIVQPTCYPPNENLMELLIVIDTAKRASAGRITAVLPYYGYARQDRKDQPRVPITAKLVANLLVAAGADRVLTMDLHAQQIGGFFDIPVDHLYASSVIVDYVRQQKLQDLVVVSPDPGGLKNAYRYSNMLSSGLALIGKQRKSPTEVEAGYLVGDVKGCDTLLVDDMTSTAGTLVAAAELLHKNGARSIRAAVSHALLCERGIERLNNSNIQELVATDSVPQGDTDGLKVTVLSVAEMFGEAICRIHNNESISDLFKV